MLVAGKLKFGERLRALREGAGLTPYQLAKLAHLSGQAITMIEVGERDPGWVTVLKLARALEVPVSVFDAGEDPREDEQPASPASETKPKPAVRKPAAKRKPKRPG